MELKLAGSNVLGNKAYGSQEIRSYITGQEATYTISPESNTVMPWECDWWLYKKRHLVECIFNKINSSEVLPHGVLKR